jgi:hypothetical protein
VRLRDVYAPEALIVVLTNGTELGRSAIWNALLRVDEACFKLDAATPSLQKVNLPLAVRWKAPRLAT